MGSFANGVFTLLLGWVSGTARFLWNLVSGGNGGSLWKWITDHWILLAGILCLSGIVIDLMVYIFRWEPFRMWRNPWSRRARDRRMNREAEKRPVASEPEWTPGTPEVMISASERQPELSRWEEQREEEPQEPEPPETTLVTPAGYRVPADSPYRRPQREYDENDGGRMMGMAPVTKRRRRLNVATLFSEAEEDLMVYQKPETIIDRHQAYHEPVYPRRWKEREDENDE